MIKIKELFGLRVLVTRLDEPLQLPLQGTPVVLSMGHRDVASGELEPFPGAAAAAPSPFQFVPGMGELARGRIEAVGKAVEADKQSDEWSELIGERSSPMSEMGHVLSSALSGYFRGLSSSNVAMPPVAVGDEIIFFLGQAVVAPESKDQFFVGANGIVAVVVGGNPVLPGMEGR